MKKNEYKNLVNNIESFIVKLRNGDFFIRKMLKASIEGQDEVRKLIFADLPDMEWVKSNTGAYTL